MAVNWVSVSIAACLVAVLVYHVNRQIKENMQQDDPMLHRLREVLEPVHPVVRTLRLYKAEKSYTINKERIYLCLLDADGDYYSLNTLVYVLLHEIAHLLNTKDVGHTEEFHRIFDDLLFRAAEIGSFNPSIPIPSDYSQH